MKEIVIMSLFQLKCNQIFLPRNVGVQNLQESLWKKELLHLKKMTNKTAAKNGAYGCFFLQIKRSQLFLFLVKGYITLKLTQKIWHRAP